MSYGGDIVFSNDILSPTDENVYAVYIFLFTATIRFKPIILVRYTRHKIRAGPSRYMNNGINRVSIRKPFKVL